MILNQGIFLFWFLATEINHEEIPIPAATIENARFLNIDHRLGNIEKGKQADLILIEGDPLADIKDMYNIKKVMLSGRWVDCRLI